MSIDVQTAPNKVSLLRTEHGQSLNIGLKHFDLDYLQGKDAITDTATGRGEVYFFDHHGTKLVLRHYHRGGLVAKLNKDKYLFTGIEATRGFQELEILDYLNYHGLNVPYPVAARIARQGLFYRADLITEAVPNSIELNDLLKEQELSPSLWEEIGRVLAKLHKLQVRHDDINVKNILIKDETKIVLLDFDKCKRQALGNWQSANLARFYRSLIKQQRKQAGNKQAYFFAASNWESLQSGYAEVLPAD